VMPFPESAQVQQGSEQQKGKAESEESDHWQY
jgi:hypothetical protein